MPRHSLTLVTVADRFAARGLSGALGVSGVAESTEFCGAEACLCRGFILRTIPRSHEARLVELGLIQAILGGLMITPAGKMLARA